MEKLLEVNRGELMDQNYPCQKVLTSADEIAFFSPFSNPPPPLPPHLNIRHRKRNPSVTRPLSSPHNLHPFPLDACSCAWWRDKLIFFHVTASIILREYIKRRFSFLFWSKHCPFFSNLPFSHHDKSYSLEMKGKRQKKRKNERRGMEGWMDWRGQGMGCILESCCTSWISQSALFDGVLCPSCRFSLHTGNDSSGCCC